MRRKNRTHGFGLLELLLALLVVAALMGVAIPLIYRGYEDARRADLVTEIGVIRQQIHALFGAAENYADLPALLPTLRNQLPSDYVSGSNIVTPWGRTITIATDNLAVGSKPRFNEGAYAITVPVTSDVCIPLVLHGQGGFDYVIVSRAANSRTLLATTVLKATPEQASVACGSGQNRSVIFVGA